MGCCLKYSHWKFIYFMKASILTTVQILREECLVLYSVIHGHLWREVGGKTAKDFCFHLAMEAARFLKRSWKYLPRKCQSDLFEACAWPLTLLFTPLTGSSFFSWGDFLCYVDSSFTSGSTLLSLIQGSRTSFTSQTLSCKLSSHLWIVTSAIPFPWNAQFSSLVWLYRHIRSHLGYYRTLKPSWTLKAFLWPHILLGILASLQLSLWFINFSQLKGVSL